MKRTRPLFDTATHYKIDLQGRVDVEWLRSFDSSVDITVDETGQTDEITVLSLHTDQAGVVGLLRRLHGLGLTIQRFQVIQDLP